jgi:Zn finger protein HypA/HybF involved in hydrogenase expression
MTAAVTGVSARPARGGPASPRRYDNVTTTSAAACPVCEMPFIPVRRQRYCCPACKQKAFRRRRQAPVSPAPAAGPPGRAARVYQGGECDQRYLGEQWCHDCNRPCRALGPGGLCPCCGEPIAISDLREQTP